MSPPPPERPFRDTLTPRHIEALRALAIRAEVSVLRIAGGDDMRWGYFYGVRDTLLWLVGDEAPALLVEALAD